MNAPNTPKRSLPIWAIAAMAALALGLAVALILLLRGQNAAGVAAHPPPGFESEEVSPGDGSSNPITARTDGSPAPPPAPHASPLADQMDAFSRHEAAFRSEGAPDPRWAMTAERSLTEAATEEALVEFGFPAEFDAKCLRRMCKVVMTFDEPGQAEDWAELYVLGMADAVTSVRTLVTRRSDGKSEVIIYGARAGSESMLEDPAQRPGSPSGQRQTEGGNRG